MERFPSIVADIMSAPVVTVDVENNVRDTAILIKEKGIGCIIVNEKGAPVGIITKRDIIHRLVSLCKDPCDTNAKEIMSSPLITINKEIGILAAMRKMRENKVTQLVVIEGEKVIGVISERDVIKAVSIASLASFSPLIRR